MNIATAVLVEGDNTLRILTNDLISTDSSHGWISFDLI